MLSCPFLLQIHIIIILGGSAVDIDVRTVHVDHLHRWKLALGGSVMQNFRGRQGYIDRRVRIYANRIIGGEILRYCQSIAKTAGKWSAIVCELFLICIHSNIINCKKSFFFVILSTQLLFYCGYNYYSAAFFVQNLSFVNYSNYVILLLIWSFLKNLKYRR